MKNESLKKIFAGKFENLLPLSKLKKKSKVKPRKNKIEPERI